jgi:hypothetical protein
VGYHIEGIFSPKTATEVEKEILNYEFSIIFDVNLSNLVERMFISYVTDSPGPSVKVGGSEGLKRLGKEERSEGLKRAGEEGRVDMILPIQSLNILPTRYLCTYTYVYICTYIYIFCMYMYAYII